MTALRILLELADDKSIETIEAQPHIRPAGSHEDARGRAQTQHRYSCPSTAIRRRNVVPSNPALTPIRLAAGQLDEQSRALARLLPCNRGLLHQFKRNECNAV